MQITEFTLEKKDALKSFLQNGNWPYHSGNNLTDEQFEKRIKNNFYLDKEQKTFLVFNEQEILIGYLRIFDLGEDKNSGETPLFDLRIKDSEQQKGHGQYIVNWLVEYIFTNYLSKKRLEATTRQDNKAMRRVLEKCGFVKEAHYRQAWPNKDKSKLLDAIGYGILREDWENKTTTPVNWND